MDREVGVAEAARILELHPSTIRTLVKKGMLFCLRDSNGWRRFYLNEVLELRKVRQARFPEGD